MKTSRIKFPRRVRIHGGECGAVARALHHEAQKEALMRHESLFLSQADFGNVSESTFTERKQMSTKTSIKRIALVAVAALGFGMVTGVSANAATATPFQTTVSLSDTGDNTATMTATQIAGAANYVEVIASDDANAQAAATDYDFITVSGSTFVYSVPATPATINAATTTSTAIYKVIGGRINNGDKFWIGTPTAGTITFKYVRRAFTAGVATDTTLQTLTITVGSADVDPAASTASLNDAQTTQATPIVDDTVVASKDAAGVVANIELTMKNLLGSAYSTSGVFSAVVSGPGLLGLDNDGTPNTVGATKVLPITFNAGKAWITVAADGTAGVATISILAGSTVWKTKTVSFSGVRTAYKVTSTVPATVKTVIGVAGTQIWNVAGVDSLGLAASNGDGTIYAVSADSTIATAVMTAGNQVTVTGVKAGTTSFRLCNTADCAAATIVLGPVSVTIGNLKASSASIAFDKATYEPGAPFTLTITAADAGFPLADGTYAAMATLTSNVVVYATDGTGYPLVLGTGAVSPLFVGGKATYTGFMPSTPGSISLSLKLGAVGTPGVADAAAGAVIAAPTVTVASASINAATAAAEAAADAAAEAIDAANAATDAANLAAEAADAATVAAEEARDAADAATAAIEELATQVASLIAALKAQITTLANTVAKIAKKVKA
jgi:hypothetical protein